MRPDAQRLHRAAVAVEEGIAHWPVTVDSSNDYGFRPIDEDGDYMNRNFAKTQEVKLLAMRDLVRSEDRWDLIHMDVQGAEFDICRDAMPDLKERSKRVMIGTHSRKLEGSLMALFAETGWVLENEKPCKFTFWPNHKTLEAMTTVDGTQTWNNPAL
jgi:FkbM family methyltransferase